MTIVPEIPSGLLSLLNGEDLEAKEGETLELVTVAEDGWPRVALLSVGEVYAPDGRELRLALWPQSTTTANLQRSGRGTLFTVHAGFAISVVLDARRISTPRGAADLAYFTGKVKEVRQDSVTYAELTAGIRFRLTRRDAVLTQWRRTIAALRDISSLDH